MVGLQTDESQVILLDLLPDTFVKCLSTKMTQFQQKNVSLNTFISCRVPGKLCYVTDKVIFCHVMSLGSINVAMEIVSTPLSK